LFQPPLSQGLHWYNAYIYSKRIPHKLEQNMPKITFYFSDSAQNRTPILPDCAPIFYELKMSNLVQKSYSDFSKPGSDFDSFSKFNFSNFESLSQQSPPWLQISDDAKPSTTMLLFPLLPTTRSSSTSLHPNLFSHRNVFRLLEDPCIKLH